MDPVALLAEWGLLLVFAAVILEHAGLPVPAPPVLVAAGALAVEGVMVPELVLATALAACVVADHAWFLAGRLRGRLVLARLCRLSISPDTCVRRTDDLIARHGPALLLVAKWVPGVSAVSIPTAAAMGVPWRRFAFYAGIGALLWCVGYIAAGMIFASEVKRLLALMGEIGGWALAALAGLFALYIAFKLHRRLQLRRLYRVVRITPREMSELMASDPELIVVDARSRVARDADPRRFPGAIEYDEGDIAAVLPHGASERTIVTFCTCPNEASAAMLAERLIKAGYARVRVLAGSEEALALLGAPGS